MALSVELDATIADGKHKCSAIRYPAKLTSRRCGKVAAVASVTKHKLTQAVNIWENPPDLRPDPLAFCRDMRRLKKPVRLSNRYHPPADGLWKVATRKGVRGGFLVAYGRVIRCSPVLRRHLHVWAQRNAEYWGNPFACE